MKIPKPGIRLCYVWTILFGCLISWAAGIPTARAATVTAPVTTGGHYTEDTTIFLPWGYLYSYNQQYNLSPAVEMNSGQTLSAAAGTTINVQIENTSLEGTYTNGLVANNGGVIDFRDSKVIVKNYSTPGHWSGLNGDVWNAHSYVKVNTPMSAYGGEIYAGNDSEFWAQNGSSAALAFNNGKISVGDNAKLYGDIWGGVNGTVEASGGEITIGKNAHIVNDALGTYGGKVHNYGDSHGVMAVYGGKVTVGDGSLIQTITPTSISKNHAVQAGFEGTSGGATAGTVILGDGVTVTTNSSQSFGILAAGAGSTVTTGSVNVTTSGYRAYVVCALRDGFVEIGANSVLRSTGSQAIIVASTESANIKIGDGTHIIADNTNYPAVMVGPNTANPDIVGKVELGDNIVIDTYGDLGYGVRAQNSHDATVTFGDGLTITTRSNSARGIHASNGAQVVVGDDAVITTAGASSSFALSSTSTVANSQSVITIGQRAILSTGLSHGMAAVTNAVINVGNDAVVTTTGPSAYGIVAQSTGRINIQNITIRPLGSGVAVAANTGGEIVGTGVMDIHGEIYTASTAVADITMTDGSQFIGSWARSADAATSRLSIDGSNSRWTLDYDSDPRDLNVSNRANVDVGEGITLIPTTLRATTGGNVNVVGSVDIQNTATGQAGQAMGRLNLYGSAGTADTVDLGESGTTEDRINTRFYIDSSATGVKSLDVSGTAYLDSVVITPTVWGWAQLASDEYTLVNNTNPRQGTTNIQNNTLTAYDVLEDPNRIYLKYNEANLTHLWEDMAMTYYFEGGSYQDMIKIENGVNEDLVATFANLTDNSLAAKLVDYLNNGMADSSLKFSVYGDGKLSLTGTDYLINGKGYFAWDLTDFNTANGSDVMLLSLAVPEPATWLMLALGLVVIYGVRRRAERKPQRGDR